MELDLITAKKLDNYEADATGGTLWTSTTTFEVVCPAGKRWFVLGGIVNRSDAATNTIEIYDSTDKPIHLIDIVSSAAGRHAWPYTIAAVTSTQRPPYFVMDAGDYLKMTFSAAQGAAAYASCVVLEVSV